MSVCAFDLLVNCFQVGAADYIAVAENYHTVFISDIPIMSMRIRDKVLFLLVRVDMCDCHMFA